MSCICIIEILYRWLQTLKGSRICDVFTNSEDEWSSYIVVLVAVACIESCIYESHAMFIFGYEICSTVIAPYFLRKIEFDAFEHCQILQLSSFEDMYVILVFGIFIWQPDDKGSTLIVYGRSKFNWPFICRNSIIRILI